MPNEAVVKEIRLNITGGGVLPGEQALVAIFNYATRVRETQSDTVRDAWDKRLLDLYDRWDAFWKNLGVV